MPGRLHRAVELPIFIVGCMRSGTSLVSHILDSHSRLTIFYESYLYNYFRTDLHLYGDLNERSNLRRLLADVCEAIAGQKITPPRVEEIESLLAAPTFPDVFAAVLQLHARSLGKSRAGDKTPDHHFYLDYIRRDFPRSPIVFVMRDPRDTVLSLCKASFCPTIESAAQAWNEAYASYVKAGRGLHLLRYEEMAYAPRETIEALCAAIGETFEPGMLQFFHKVPERLKKEEIHKKLTRAIDTSSVGNFRKMPAKDIELIESLCGEGMAAMGYPFVGGHTPARLVRPAAPGTLRRIGDRLHYYGFRWDRWQAGLVRWKMMLRLRLRYWLMPKRLRSRVAAS